MSIDPSHPLSFVAFTIGLPALATGLVLLVARRRPELVPGVGALALGLGYVIGHRASLGAWPPIPPADAKGATLWLAAAAALAGALRGFSTIPRAVGWLALAVVACGAPWLVLRNLMKRWTLGESVTTALLIAVATVALASALDGWSVRRKGASLPLVAWLVVSVAAGAMFLTGSAIFAQFAGTLAAVLAAAAVFALIERDASFARGPTAFFVVTFATLCVACVYLSGLPRSSALLFFYAPLAAVALDRGALARKPALTRIAVLLAAVAAVSSLALWLAWRSQASSSDD